MLTPGSLRAGAEGLLHHPATPVKWAALGHESFGPTPTAAAAFAKSGQNVPGLPRAAPFAGRSAWQGAVPALTVSSSHGAFPARGSRANPEVWEPRLFQEAREDPLW